MVTKTIALGLLAILTVMLLAAVAPTQGTRQTRVASAERAAGAFYQPSTPTLTPTPRPQPRYLPIAFALADVQSGIQIQNLDPSLSASVSADFYTSAGAFQHTINMPSTAPGAAANIYLPGSSLPPGGYAAIILSDRQITAIARADWPASGGAAFYRNVIASTSTVLALAVRNYFDHGSLVSVQNTNAQAPALVTVDFVESGASTPMLSKDYSIPAGTSITMDLRRDPAFEPLGRFLGSVFVTSATEVGLMSFVEVTGARRAVYAFEGGPLEMAWPTLYVPLFRAKQYPRPGDAGSGRFDTAIAVVNPGESPVSVTITYYGAGGTCDGDTMTSAAVRIAAHSNHVFYQGDPVGQGLKEDCYGSAVINATGGNILAIVNDAQNLNQTAAAYNAVTVDEAATRVALPLYRKNHAGGLTTGISAMNVGTETAQISVNFTQSNPDGSSVPIVCGGPCTQTVGVNQTAIFWLGAISELPNNSYGSATVQSTQPVAVIVNDVNPTGSVDMASYNSWPISW